MTNRPTATRPRPTGTPTPPRPPRARPRPAWNPTARAGRRSRRSRCGATTKGSVTTLVDRLNADPAKYPPPIPPGKTRARGAWGKTSVFEILKNPKYTGYQVFNRRASRSAYGKVNDPVKWVWSTEPAHEPLIPKWMRQMRPRPLGRTPPTWIYWMRCRT
ncbi:MAG TPA: recombinase family protein [Pseudonocardiaceae bacterium]|nr:recombinase family protein [Pseudonocardiaceae bacterium]